MLINLTSSQMAKGLFCVYDRLQEELSIRCFTKWQFVNPSIHDFQCICENVFNIYKNRMMATKPLSSFNNYKLKANLAYRWIILSIVKSITYRIICSYIVQSLRCVWLRSHELQHARLLWPSLSPWVLRLMSIESVRPFNHLVLCSFLLSLNLSQCQGFF